MQDILILHACSLSIRKIQFSPYIYLSYNEACIGYFGIRDIDLLVFLRDTGIFVFLVWDMHPIDSLYTVESVKDTVPVIEHIFGQKIHDSGKYFACFRVIRFVSVP